jgi:hypothetical protein
MTHDLGVAMDAMTSLEYVTLEVDDHPAAERFYTSAFGLGSRVRLRGSKAPTSGFRAFTLSLVVSQPATVDAFVRAALDAGATSRKPAAKQFWGGYSGVVQTPDGTIGKSRPRRRRTPARRRGRSTRSFSCWASLILPRASASTSTTAWRSPRALPARASSSPPRQSTSSWGLQAPWPWPRTPASPRTAPDCTGS